MTRLTKLLSKARALLKLDVKAELSYEQFKHAMLGETRTLVGRENIGTVKEVILRRRV